MRTASKDGPPACPGDFAQGPRQEKQDVPSSHLYSVIIQHVKFSEAWSSTLAHHAMLLAANGAAFAHRSSSRSQRRSTEAAGSAAEATGSFQVEKEARKYSIL